ncbi:rhodanese-like domain-containing protein [Pseudoxanthomonas mexicana]
MARTVQDLVIEARSRIQEIAPDQLAAQDDCVLIDVREPAEYVQGHLPGAINLPRGVLEFQIHAHPAMACTSSEALAVADRELVLYCLTGGRSALAADSLQALGFTRVRSLAGGLTAWRNASHPLIPETA